MALGKIPFDQWKRAVDVAIFRRVGLTANDLPDWDYYSAYLRGITPDAAGARAIRIARSF
jgi:hypothetical protein